MQSRVPHQTGQKNLKAHGKGPIKSIGIIQYEEAMPRQPNRVLHRLSNWDPRDTLETPGEPKN
jgi:hypothetical protein